MPIYLLILNPQIDTIRRVISLELYQKAEKRENPRKRPKKSYLG